MSMMASQITSLTIVYSTVYPWRRSKKTSKLHITGLCGGIHRWPVNSLHKGPVMRKMFPFDCVIIHFIEFQLRWIQYDKIQRQIVTSPSSFFPCLTWNNKRNQHCPLGNVAAVIKVFKCWTHFINLYLLVKLLPGEYHKTVLTISQQWFCIDYTINYIKNEINTTTA